MLASDSGRRSSGRDRSAEGCNTTQPPIRIPRAICNLQRGCGHRWLCILELLCHILGGVQPTGLGGLRHDLRSGIRMCGDDRLLLVMSSIRRVR